MNLGKGLKALSDWNFRAFGFIMTCLDKLPPSQQKQILIEICRHGVLHNRQTRAMLEEIEFAPEDEETAEWVAHEEPVGHPIAQLIAPVDEGTKKDVEELKRMLALEYPKNDPNWYRKWLETNNLTEE